MHGKRWWRRGPGTTYHSCEIWVDDVCVHRIEFAYGPDQMYEQSGKNWLYANGYLPGMEMKQGTPSEAIWRYCERMNIHYTSDAVNVQRKKDL